MSRLLRLDTLGNIWIIGHESSRYLFLILSIQACLQAGTAGQQWSFYIVDASSPEHLDQLTGYDAQFFGFLPDKALVAFQPDRIELLQRSGFNPVLFDADPGEGACFQLSVAEDRVDTLPDAIRILYAEDGTVLFQAEPADAEQAAIYGFGLTAISSRPVSAPKARPALRTRPMSGIESEFYQSMVDNVSQSEITSTIRDLQNFQTRYTYTDSCRASAEYLFGRFTDFGLAASFDEFEYNGSDQRNVVAVYPGLTDPDRIYIICGHYDSINNHGDSWLIAPGADDNGSGCGRPWWKRPASPVHVRF